MGTLMKNGVAYGGGSGGTSDYDDLSNKPSINGTTLSGNKTASDLGLAETGDIPTKTSELTNDSGFITKSVNDLDNYYPKTQTYTKSEVDDKVSALEIDDLDDVNIATPSNNDVLKYNSTSGKWENGAGGGAGGGHTIEDAEGTDLTQRDTMQFSDGLSASDDSTNEKTVVTLDPMPAEDIDEVVDIYPARGNLVSIVNAFNKGDLYSTEERMIGQWIDGKPLYQKSFNITLSSTQALSSGVNTNLFYGTKDISSIVQNIDNCIVLADKSYWTLDNSIRGFVACWYENPATIFVMTLYSRTNVEGHFTIQYTKTTDTAISIGEATEYSTEEKIVGTWIDGKPIYQKTIVGLNANFAWNSQYFAKQSFTETMLGISNIERIINGIVSSDSASSIWELTGSMINSATDIGLFIHNAIDKGTVNITLQYTKTAS